MEEWVDEAECGMCGERVTATDMAILQHLKSMTKPEGLRPRARGNPLSYLSECLSPTQQICNVLPDVLRVHDST